MDSSTSMIDETISKITIMCRQEENVYRTHDYLQVSAQTHHTSGIAIDKELRSQMCDWCDQVVEFCEMSHNSVEIAISYMDRFCATNEGVFCGVLSDRRTFQMAFMTALYTAIKINEPVCVSPLVISKLSQGLYSIDEIEVMESYMLTALKWRTNPPTTAAFLEQFLELFPELTSNPTLRLMIDDLTSVQIQSVISDYAFVTTKASTIAYFSLINAMQSLNILSCDGVVARMAGLAKVIGLNLDYYSNDDAVLQNCLYKVIIADQRLSVKNEMHLDTAERAAISSSELSTASLDSLHGSIPLIDSPCHIITVAQY
jgi:Cyclin, N-terminal domain